MRTAEGLQGRVEADSGDGQYAAAMNAGSPTTSQLPPEGRRADVVTLGRELLPAMIAAGLVGFLVGGVGGRIAMLILRLTSGPEVVGLESDDGFVIGRVSTDSVGLLVLVTAGATLSVGPLYPLLRLCLPVSGRAPMLALLFAVVGGAALVHADGIDFVALSPRALAVALFVAIPAGFGALLEPAHRLAAGWMQRLPDRAVLGLAGVATVSSVLVPPGAVLALLTWGVALLGERARVGRWLATRPVTWAGRLALLALFAVSAAKLAGDVRALLL